MGISALRSTDPPNLFGFAHGLYLSDHFLPLLTTSYS